MTPLPARESYALELERLAHQVLEVRRRYGAGAGVDEGLDATVGRLITELLAVGHALAPDIVSDPTRRREATGTAELITFALPRATIRALDRHVREVGAASVGLVTRDIAVRSLLRDSLVRAGAFGQLGEDVP